MTSGFDLAVVGAGVVGTLVAYLAARRRPDRSILLLDRQGEGHGATARSIGLMPAIATTPAQRPFVARSAALYREMERDGVALPISRVPALWVVSRDGRRDLENRLGRQLAGASAADSAEPLSLPAAEMALRDGPVPRVDAARLVAELQRRLLEGDACRSWRGVEVHDLAPERGRWRLDLADGRSVAATQVVLATGPWARSGPFAACAAAAGVRVKKVVALHIDRAPAACQPLLLFPDHDAFVLPASDGRTWLLSISSPQWDCAPEPSRLRIDAADRRAGLSVLERYLPSLVEGCVGGQLFCDAYTPERAPLVLEAARGVVLCGGGSGGGVRMGPAAAEAALDRLG